MGWWGGGGVLESRASHGSGLGLTVQQCNKSAGAEPGCGTYLLRVGGRDLPAAGPLHHGERAGERDGQTASTNPSPVLRTTD